MGYQRITMEEREEIFRLRYEERLFLREIGQKLHKDKSASFRRNPEDRRATSLPPCFICGTVLFL
jgi:IS30 family transposase